jgi:hypothetical protein
MRSEIFLNLFSLSKSCPETTILWIKSLRISRGAKMGGKSHVICAQNSSAASLQLHLSCMVHFGWLGQCLMHIQSAITCS